MKIGDKDYQVTGDAKRQQLLLEVKVWGVRMASEQISLHEARGLVLLLQQGIAQAEGKAPL